MSDHGGGEDNGGFDLPDLQTAQQNFLGVDANDPNAHTYVYDQNKSLQGMTVRERLGSPNLDR